ncbi:hypothetical protein HPB47_025733 [Ixodes persulcatus]|uniref:Uncharacterized protein n=1 Tax=Ixodes persulcatus TaxID=34615 RepID=A0AC60Q2I5_IXOPE|nr:hypothetical protein HPB47_025733 [Ixodes persulcatus]
MTNTISVTVYDERHLASLLQLTHLETGSGRVDVQVYRTATLEFPRGVVHLTPDIPPANLLEGLRADYHEIVLARPLGSNGTYLLTFQGQGVPRRIRAWHEIIQVKPYRPSTVVCNNRHGLGHKSDICTEDKRCQSCDGLLTEGHRCETVKCRNCGSQNHVATSRDCPERKKDLAKDQHELHLFFLQHTRRGRAILQLLRQDVSTLPKLSRPITPWEIADVASSPPVPRNMGLDQPERRRDYAQKYLTVVTTKLEDPKTPPPSSWSRETKTSGTPEDAEAHAFLHALQHVTQSLNSPVKTVDIYTDAQEAMRRCRKHDPNSPTTRPKTLRPLYTGSPAMPEYRATRPLTGVDSVPSTSANSGKTGPKKQGERRDRTPYDPEDAMSKVRQHLMKRLLASLPREPDPIPLGRYSRKKMVLLLRITTGRAWELSAGKIGRNRPPMSAAVRRPPRPSRSRCNASIHWNSTRSVPTNLHHLVWECGHFTDERKRALCLLPPASRPSSLEGWARPEEDSARIALILDSLLLYLENTGLESTF